MAIERNSQPMKPLAAQSTRNLDLRKLPLEIKIRILDFVLLQRPPCLSTLFRGSCSVFPCEFDHGDDGLCGSFPVTPRLDISSISEPYFLHEMQKSFFRNHTFVFGKLSIGILELNTRWRAGITSNDTPPDGLDSGINLFVDNRDPRATRLLEFIDRPGWKGKGSSNFKWDKSYSYVDKHRHRIQHLVLSAEEHLEAAVHEYDARDWDWPLKVDWKSLPNLKTLVLDLRTYSLGPEIAAGPSVWETKEEQFEEELLEGAKKMESMNLHSLTIYGLCSCTYWQKKDHRRKIERLFQKVLAKNKGQLVLEEQPRSVVW